MMTSSTPQINWFIFILATVVGAAGLTYGLISIDAFEFIFEFTRSHEDWEVDEILLAFISLLLVYGILATVALLFLTKRITRYVITKQALLQEDFYVTQNLRALGTLLAGFTHSLNNLVQPIVTLSGHLLDTTDKDDPQHTELDIIHTAAMQAHTLSHDILTVSRQDSTQAQEIALDSLVKDMLPILKAAIPSRITLEHAIAPCGQVKVVARHVQTAMLNIVHNSVDAIVSSGNISISTRQARAEHPNQFLGLMKDWALLEITDDGIGMTKGVRQRVFDPFFTTKDVGKGTGLGLSIAQTMAHECGGFIKVTSTPGKGTSVLLYFPLEETSQATPSS